MIALDTLIKREGCPVRGLTALYAIAAEMIDNPAYAVAHWCELCAAVCLPSAPCACPRHRRIRHGALGQHRAVATRAQVFAAVEMGDVA